MPLQLLRRGEVDLMPFWNGGTVRLQAAGQPFEFRMLPGSYVTGACFVIPKGVKNSGASNKFVNNALDPTLQTEFAKFSKYPPTNRKAKVPGEFEKFALNDDLLRSVARVDWAKVSVNRAPHIERWNKEILR